MDSISKPRFHGERARALRYRRRLSAREVAKRAGIHWRYYLRLEKNERPNASAINVAAVALALETTVEYLLGLTDDPRSVAAIFSDEKARRGDGAMMNLGVERHHFDVFVQEFLTALVPILEAPTPRALAQQVQAVCERFQERGRGDIRVAVIPLAFWTQFTVDFVEAYMEEEDESRRFERLKRALRERLQQFARSHTISLEDLNA